MMEKLILINLLNRKEISHETFQVDETELNLMVYKTVVLYIMKQCSKMYDCRKKKR